MKMKYLSIILASTMLFSCAETETATVEETPEVTNEQEATPVEEANFAITKNFAVIWSMKTEDVNLINDNVVDQAKQLTDYWNAGKIENAYFNTDPQEEVMDYPTISFFVKATSYDEAVVLMNEMIFVKKGIAKYGIYPVGTMLYGRNPATTSDMSGKHAWVSVWGTSDDNTLSEKEKEELTILQSQVIQSEYDQGIIENVYFNIEGVSESNSTADFVMFVNAETEDEARKILDELPYVTNNMAKYQLFDVGVFWMGVQ